MFGSQLLTPQGEGPRGNFMATVRFTAAVAALFAVAAEAGAADRTYSVEISPSGKHYAVLRDAGEQRAFAIYAADDVLAAPKGIGLGTIEIEDVEWGNDDFILVRVAGEKGGIDTTAGLKTLNVSRWMSISRESGAAQTLFGNERGNDYFYFINSAGALLLPATGGGEHALFARTSIEVKPGGPSRLQKGEDLQLYSLQRANLRTGKAEMVREGAPDTIDWVVNASGDVIARIDQSELSKKISVTATAPDGKFSAPAGEIAGDVAERESPSFFGAVEGARALQLFKAQGGGYGMYVYSLDPAGIGSMIAAPGPLQRAVYDPRFARARIAYYLSAAGERPFHFDADDQRTQASLEKALSGAAVSIVSKSTDGTRMIARADYQDKGAEFYFFDKAAKRLELVAANE